MISSHLIVNISTGCLSAFWPRTSTLCGLPKCHRGNNLPANAGDTRDVGLISGLRRSPGVGNGNPLQYSYMENSTERGAWRATVHGVVKSQTQLSNLVHTHTVRECSSLDQVPKCWEFLGHLIGDDTEQEEKN